MATPEKNMRRESLVLRVIWMLIFLLAWYIAVPLLGLLVAAQLLFRLFMGAPSGVFMSFGDSLSQYLGQIGRFAVFNTDAKPWPVADWPTARTADGQPAHAPQEQESVDVAVVTPPATVAAEVVKPEAESVSEVSEVSEAVDADVQQTQVNVEEVQNDLADKQQSATADKKDSADEPKL